MTLAGARAGMIAPYYDDGRVSIYNADCADVLPTISPESVGLLLADPPYGIDFDTAYGARGRGVKSGALDHPQVHDDDRPYDPTPLLLFPRLVLFGANHYADKLPASGAWIVWDKLDGLVTEKREQGFNDGADAELAWTNLGGTVRMYRHMWNGVLRRSEIGEHLHPTQKPVALMRWIIQRASSPGDLVLDPFMGSGPVARACADLGRRYIGIEISERYCRIAVDRLGQQVLDVEAA